MRVHVHVGCMMHVHEICTLHVHACSLHYFCCMVFNTLCEFCMNLELGSHNPNLTKILAKVINKDKVIVTCEFQVIKRLNESMKEEGCIHLR